MIKGGRSWRITRDEADVIEANYRRGNSIRLSARILRRTEHSVRAREIKDGLKRRGAQAVVATG